MLGALVSVPSPLAQSGGLLVRRPKPGLLTMGTCSYLLGDVSELLFALVDAVLTAFGSAESAVASVY